jgi:hypothetical protein
MQVYECILVYWYLYCYTSLKGPCFAVSLGCIHDEVWSEPGSWLVVGMIPVFDKKKAIRTKLRTEDGPMGPVTGGSLGNCPRQFPSHILGKLPLVPAGLPRLRKPPVLHQLLGHDLASGLQEGWEMNNKKQIARTLCPSMPLLMVCSLLCSLGKLCCCVDCNFVIYYPNTCIYIHIHAKYWL